MHFENCFRLFFFGKFSSEIFFYGFFSIFRTMSEEVPADVEMAPATEETPQKLPVPKESDLPIEDIDDIDEVSYFFLSRIWINSNLFFFFEV